MHDHFCPTARLLRLAALLPIAAILLSLFGCAAEEASSETLRLSGIMADQQRAAIYRDALTAFSADHSDVYIRDISTDADDAFKLELNISKTYSGSDSPHIIYYYNDPDMELLAEHFVSVQEIRDDYPDFLSEVGDNAIDCAAWSDGKTYCIPVMGDWNALAVNTRLFADCDAPLPRTWKNLNNAISKLSSSNIIPFANSAEDSAFIIEALVRSAGGQNALKSGLAGDASALDDSWVTAMSYYKQLCQIDAFAPSAYTTAIAEYADAPTVYDSVLGADRDKTRRFDAVELFNSGKAAMLAVDRDTFMRLEYLDDIILMDFPDFNETYDEEDNRIVSDTDIASMSDLSSLEASKTETLPSRIHGGYNEGFYITRKAYSDPVLRPLVMELVAKFTSAETGAGFAELGYITSNVNTTPHFSQLQRISGAAAAGAAYQRSYTGIENTARWSYVKQCAVQLWYGLITPEKMAELLHDDSKNAIDVLEQLDRDETQNDIISSADADKAVSASDR